MKTNVDLEYLPPFTYDLDDATLWFDGADWELPDPPEPTDSSRGAPHADETPSDVSQTDLGYFMRLAGGFELLTAEEERRLGLGLWDARRRLLRILRRRARLTSGSAPSLALEPRSRTVTAATRRRLGRVEKLARELAEAEPDSFLADTLQEMDSIRRKLVEHNLRLVVWVAKNFRGRGFDFIDLIQEGSLGLMRAIDRFDPLVGARFSTFATHWIRQGIRRALAEKARTIRIPVNRIPEVRETLLVRSQLSEKLGRPARAEEISRETGIPAQKIEELLPAIAPIDSLDAAVPSTDRSLLDTLEDRTTKTPIDEAMAEETRRAIHAVLHELPPRQRVILSMRHGIDYPKECTLDEIGEALGLSRERIRQVEKAAAAAVRDWLRKHRPTLARPV